MSSKVLDTLFKKTNLTREEIVFLLSLSDEDDIRKLYLKADEIRKKCCGDDVHLRGLIEFSNNCEQDCLYCGIRRGNTSIERYRMCREEIIGTARNIFNAGLKTVVLQSGEDSWFTKDDLSEIIASIKGEMDIAVTLSLGERSNEDYIAWKKAGADRYLLKHETANPHLYSMYHQRQKLTGRIKTLIQLKSIGYQVGSGNLIGLPYQTLEDIADDINTCKELNVDIASFSPFIPSPNTPYANKKPGDADLVFKTIAVTRLVLKDVHIPATTAMAILHMTGREKALKVGANVIMPNFTPTPYRNFYLVYPDKHMIDAVPSDSVVYLKFLIDSMGRKMGISKGDSLKASYISN